MNCATVSFLLIACCYASCQSFDTFDQMAMAMCRGKVIDVTMDEVPAEAQVIDVRTSAEWEVSHLPQAIHAEWNGQNFVAMPAVELQHPILVYCSVGYRSEKAGEYLMGMGASEVYNLYGGIFKLYNDQYCPNGASAPLSQIHGYSHRWGRWITRGGVRYE